MKEMNETDRARRDAFAGQALVALLSRAAVQGDLSQPLPAEDDPDGFIRRRVIRESVERQHIARTSFLFADMMLAAAEGEEDACTARVVADYDRRQAERLRDA